ncbi:hypothetical protein BDA96_10G355000 [Sorghum bicolor]|uniref:Uncharacterized protein n=1 Tax=Sorghum bicolor TaxID=4558 RepID=A0A921U391_SORBI|nr:hypothetical protein BDA96_10G355000 [Sorghum bicolor]
MNTRITQACMSINPWLKRNLFRSCIKNVEAEEAHAQCNANGFFLEYNAMQMDKMKGRRGGKKSEHVPGVRCGARLLYSPACACACACHHHMADGTHHIYSAGPARPPVTSCCVRPA